MSVKLDSLTDMCFSKKAPVVFAHFHTLISVNWLLVSVDERPSQLMEAEPRNCVNKSNQNGSGHICWHFHRKTDFRSMFGRQFSVHSLCLINNNKCTHHTFSFVYSILSSASWNMFWPKILEKLGRERERERQWEWNGERQKLLKRFCHHLRVPISQWTQAKTSVYTNTYSAQFIFIAVTHIHWIVVHEFGSANSATTKVIHQ